jgi:hypothetical protein
MLADDRERDMRGGDDLPSPHYQPARARFAAGWRPRHNPALKAVAFGLVGIVNTFAITAVFLFADTSAVRHVAAGP